MPLQDHPLTGAVLRTRSIVDRPFRPSRRTPGITQQTLTANRPARRGEVLVVLVLGTIGEHVQETPADLIRMMKELGWTPVADHPILSETGEGE